MKSQLINLEAKVDNVLKDHSSARKGILVFGTLTFSSFRQNRVP